MEFAEIAADLYSGPPERFVARRKELADQAKKAGEKDLAKRVGALRKPTKSAWLVNLLAHNDADRIDSWLELGEAMVEAQQSLAGDQLRELNRQRTTAARQLSRRAAELAAAAGESTTEAALQEVASTLQAAWTDPELAELVRNGWVHQATSYGGFGPLVPGAGPAKPKRTEPAEPPKDGGKKSPADRKARAEEERRAQEQREQEERERAERERLEAEIEAADAELESAADRLTELRERQAELSDELKQVTADERDQAKLVGELRARITKLRRSLTP